MKPMTCDYHYDTCISYFITRNIVNFLALPNCEWNTYTLIFLEDDDESRIDRGGIVITSRIFKMSSYYKTLLEKGNTFGVGDQYYMFIESLRLKLLQIMIIISFVSNYFNDFNIQK